MNRVMRDDLSVLTTVPASTFSKLENKIEWCISDAIEQAILNKEDNVEIDLGFGLLLISFTNNEIRYKFKPSVKFEKTVTDTIIKEQNVLTSNIENSLITKLTNVYKTFF